ncbi:MAG: TIGR01777 family oxidoreductase [Ginsengibacter sp.]
MPVVLISGGTGLVGTNLTRHLLQRNYEVIILTREKNRSSDNPLIQFSYWNVDDGILDGEVIKKADHIIHLAGAGVMDKNWSAAYKKLIVDSRTKSAELIIQKLKENLNQVKTFVSASAIGYYGEDAKPLIRIEGFVETDLAANDFLGETCLLWEASTDPVKMMNIRLVKLRSGIVLSNDGGAFKEFKSPLKFGVAPIFGTGKQIMSWIHIDDISRMYCEAIENNYLSGVYNAVAPGPVSQKKLIISMAERLRNKFYIAMYAPRFLLELFLGKRSTEILKSATVSDKNIKSSQFTFLYPTIDAALEDLLPKSSN